MGIKHLSIGLGKTYVKGALLMISSTSNNIVYSSSKWLQKVGGGGGVWPPAFPLKSASNIVVHN